MDPEQHHLTPAQWLPRAAAHRARVQRFAGPFLERRSTGRKHPVEDFLFTYYTEKPGRLQRWHPGAGVVLLGDEAAGRAGWKFHRTVGLEDVMPGSTLGHDDAARHRAHAGTERDAAPDTAPDAARDGGTGVVFDDAAFAAARGATIAFARSILAGAASRPARFSCFGLHEWAMAYRSEDNGVRHDYLPLRLGAAGTDRVVEENRIRCTHFDAFRFYAPQARGLNELEPTRTSQSALEQPGCLHANMDLYKWAYKLAGAVDSDLLMDTFELAWDIRTMDMQASPYDLGDWGYEPIRIETADGKAQYVQLQKDFARRADTLRARLLEVAARLAVPGGLAPAGESATAGGRTGNGALRADAAADTMTEAWGTRT
jgi:hypothetical protein